MFNHVKLASLGIDILILTPQKSHQNLKHWKSMQPQTFKATPYWNEKLHLKNQFNKETL